MKDSVQIPVLIAGLATKVDGSVKITLETRELNGDMSAQLFDLRGAEAWAIIAPHEQKDISLPSERPDPAIGTKTPSQRLRAVIYRLWQQSSGGTDFESYYRVKLENVIDQFKSKLN